jgi:hypothetical protein
MQQRAMNGVLVELVLSHGEEIHDKNGDIFYCLNDRKRRHRFAHQLRKAADKLEAKDGLFAVESGGGELKTTGHQYRRHRPRNATGRG